MPDLRYTFTKSVGGTGSAQIQFFAIDSESIWVQKNNFTEMIAFLENGLATSTAKWKVVFAHHPGYSAGRYPGISDIRQEVISRMEQYNADMYVTGHDHNMQHLRKSSGSDLDHVVSGAGGRRLYEYDEDSHQEITGLGVQLLNFQQEWGFVAITVSENTMKADYIDIDGKELYSFVRQK